MIFEDLISSVHYRMKVKSFSSMATASAAPAGQHGGRDVRGRARPTALAAHAAGAGRRARPRGGRAHAARARRARRRLRRPRQDAALQVRKVVTRVRQVEPIISDFKSEALTIGDGECQVFATVSYLPLAQPSDLKAPCVKIRRNVGAMKRELLEKRKVFHLLQYQLSDLVLMAQ